MIKKEDYESSRKLQRYVGGSCDYYGRLYLFSIFKKDIPTRGEPLNNLKKTLDVSVSRFGHLPLFKTIASTVGKSCNHIPQKRRVKEDYSRFPDKTHHSIEQICMLFGKLREYLLSNNQDPNFNIKEVRKYLDEASKLDYLPPILYMSQAVTSLVGHLDPKK